METTQNLIGLRLGDPVLASLWDGAHIERIELLWEETLALEGRAGYYDHAGALKDVVQNHLMQLLCLVAMEPPARRTSVSCAMRRSRVLRAVGPSADRDRPAQSSCPLRSGAYRRSLDPGLRQ